MPLILARMISTMTAGFVLVAVCLLSGAPAQAGGVVGVPLPAPGPALDPSVTTAVNLDQFEVQLMAAINDVRANAGLSPIRFFDTCVDKLSEDWARHIASTGVLEHRDQTIVLGHCHQAWAGEDLVRGTLLTPAVIVDAWMNSTSHRKILLKSRATRAGIAISVDGQGRYVGVLNFSDRN